MRFGRWLPAFWGNMLPAPLGWKNKQHSKVMLRYREVWGRRSRWDGGPTKWRGFRGMSQRDVQRNVCTKLPRVTSHKAVSCAKYFAVIALACNYVSSYTHVHLLPTRYNCPESWNAPYRRRVLVVLVSQFWNHISRLILIATLTSILRNYVVGSIFKLCRTHAVQSLLTSNICFHPITRA